MASQDSRTPATARGTKRKLILRNSTKPEESKPAADDIAPSPNEAEDLNDDEVDRLLEAEEQEVEDVERWSDLDVYTTDAEKGDEYTTDTQQRDNFMVSGPANQHGFDSAVFQDPRVITGWSDDYEYPDLTAFYNPVESQGVVDSQEALSKLVRGHGGYILGDNKWIEWQQERLEDIEEAQYLRDLAYRVENPTEDQDEGGASQTRGYYLANPISTTKKVDDALKTTSILVNILSKVSARELLRFRHVSRRITDTIMRSKKLQGKLFFTALYPSISQIDQYYTNPASDSSGAIQNKKLLHARKIHGLPAKIKLGGRNKHGNDQLGEMPEPSYSGPSFTINPLLFSTKGKLLESVLLTTATIDAGECYVLQFRTHSHLGSWLSAPDTTCKEALISDPPLQTLTGFITGFRETIANHGKRNKKSASPEDDEDGADGAGEAANKGKGKGKGTASADWATIPAGTKTTTFSGKVKVVADEGVTLGAVLKKALDFVAKKDNDGARPGQEIVFDLYFPVGAEVSIGY